MGDVKPVSTLHGCVKKRDTNSKRVSYENLGSEETKLPTSRLSRTWKSSGFKLRKSINQILLVRSLPLTREKKRVEDFFMVLWNADSIFWVHACLCFSGYH